jgi:hypothetical protein
MRKSLKGRAACGNVREIMKGFAKRSGTAVMLLCLLTVSTFMLAGCGGGDGVATQVVSGVAAVGVPLAGEAESRIPRIGKRRPLSAATAPMPLMLPT